MCIYIYIYIERERERDIERDTYICIYLYVYIYIYISLAVVPFWGSGAFRAFLTFGGFGLLGTSLLGPKFVSIRLGPASPADNWSKFAWDPKIVQTAPGPASSAQI